MKRAEKEERRTHAEMHAQVKEGSLELWLAWTERLPDRPFDETYLEDEGTKLWLRNCRACFSTLSRKVPK